MGCDTEPQRIEGAWLSLLQASLSSSKPQGWDKRLTKPSSLDPPTLATRRGGTEPAGCLGASLPGPKVARNHFRGARRGGAGGEYRSSRGRFGLRGGAQSPRLWYRIADQVPAPLPLSRRRCSASPGTAPCLAKITSWVACSEVTCGGEFDSQGGGGPCFARVQRLSSELGPDLVHLTVVTWPFFPRAEHSEEPELRSPSGRGSDPQCTVLLGNCGRALVASLVLSFLLCKMGVQS